MFTSAKGWIQSDIVDPLLADATQFDMAPIELRGADLSPLRPDASAMSKADLPRHLAQQVADVARMMPDRPVELTLSPDELGRLRLTFNMDGGAMAVAVNVDRPETLDLMRRHIETLAQELRDLGYEDVSFTFSQNSGGQPKHDDDTRDGNSADTWIGADLSAEAEANKKSPARLTLGAPGGVDIRI